MSNRSSREIQMIQEMAKNGKVDKEYLSFGYKSDVETYFTTFSQENNIMEYSFDNLKGLGSLLGKMWGEEEKLVKLAHICAVAAFKERQIVDTGSDKMGMQSTSSTADVKLPSAVYVF